MGLRVGGHEGGVELKGSGLNADIHKRNARSSSHLMERADTKRLLSDSMIVTQKE